MSATDRTRRRQLQVGGGLAVGVGVVIVCAVLRGFVPTRPQALSQRVSPREWAEVAYARAGQPVADSGSLKSALLQVSPSLWREGCRFAVSMSQLASISAFCKTFSTTSQRWSVRVVCIPGPSRVPTQGCMQPGATTSCRLSLTGLYCLLTLALTLALPRSCDGS